VGEHCLSRSLALPVMLNRCGWPGRYHPRARSASTGDDGVFHRADSGDLGAQHHSVAQVQSRGAPNAAAGRGAGEDQVTGLEGDPFGQPGDQLGNGEDQVRRPAVLHLQVVDVPDHLDVVDVLELVEGHQVGGRSG
jgi:hypothetical protein